MALRDTSWVLDTASALITANANVTRSDRGSNFTPLVDVTNDTAGFVYTTRQLRQAQTTIEREWICLTESAADAVLADTTNAAKDLQKRETNRIVGSYKIVQRLDTFGDFALVT